MTSGDDVYAHLEKCEKCRHPKGWDDKIKAWWSCYCEVE